MKTIWITGASSGLGAEISKQAQSKGYRIVKLARSFSTSKMENQNIISVHMDLLDENQVMKTVKYLSEQGLAPDVVINNAGIGIFKTAWDINQQEAEQIFRVNVLGMMALTGAVIPIMKEKQSGHIIQIGSQAGKLATAKASVYAASKHAVIGYSNAIRLELKPFGIAVSTVNPGPIATPFLKQADPSGSYENSIKKWLLDPTKVAERVVRLIETPKREVNLPWWMNVAAKAHAVAPHLFESIAGPFLTKK
ncbi:SDR family NAD(P)-dependent oxidoreductase [Shouchella patagoniensis]|uniref:SDR family NAD(P)-dependent oxidoreductase n=1 Tax=Shouchella patagoniensis TaxID=228576 RepID=UPI000995DCA0|nr:SDR family oxidoreductase [Shouchella patagoniensis]